MIETQAVAVADAATLAQLAQAINEAHARAEEGVRMGAERARNVGALLLRARSVIAHGNWLAWLEGKDATGKSNVSVSPREAQRYMRIAKRWEELRANASRMTHLSLTDGLRILAGDVDDEPDGGDEDDAPLTEEEFAARLEEEEREAIRQSQEDVAHLDYAAFILLVRKYLKQLRKKAALVTDGDVVALTAALGAVEAGLPPA